MNNQSCISTMKLLGDYWTLRIIDTLSLGEQRFCEIQRSLDNLNPATLTNRLKKLENHGLINRTEDKIDNVSVSYCLTESGREATSIIDAMNNLSSELTSR